MTSEQAIDDLGNRVMALETAITGLNLADGRTTAQATIDVEDRAQAIEQEIIDMQQLHDRMVDSKIKTAIELTQQKSRQSLEERN